MNWLIVPLYTLLDLFATIFACLFVNWWAPLFAYEGAVWDRNEVTRGPVLPEWLCWFNTFDATLDAGLLPGETSSYWTRMRWLYRNPAYGFSYWVLGHTFEPQLWICDEYHPYPSTFTFRAHDVHGNFEYMAVWFGIKIKVGWKAWNYFSFANNIPAWRNDPWGPEMIAPFVFSISLAK